MIPDSLRACWIVQMIFQTRTGSKEKNSTPDGTRMQSFT